MDTKRNAPRGRPAKSRPDGKRGRRGAGASEPRDVRFFRTQAQWRAWLESHHRGTAARWVGFWRVATGRPSITWPQSVDEALCFGWIDGLRRGLDAERYAIRVSPRSQTSLWRRVNRERDAARERKGMALLGGADAGLSQAHRPLGGEREAGSDARTAPRGVARGLRSREGHTAARQVGEGEAAAPVRRRTAARVVASTLPALTLYSNTTHSIRWHPPGAPEARSQHTDFAGH